MQHALKNLEFSNQGSFACLFAGAAAVAVGAVAAAGVFALPAVLDHTSDDQSHNDGQNSQNQYSSHKECSFPEIAKAGGGGPSPAEVVF